MVDVESEVEGELTEDAVKTRNEEVIKRQHEFEKKQAKEQIKDLEKEKKKFSFKKYLDWIIIFLVVLTLIFFTFYFGLV